MSPRLNTTHGNGAGLRRAERGDLFQGSGEASEWSKRAGWNEGKKRKKVSALVRNVIKK